MVAAAAVVPGRRRRGLADRGRACSSGSPGLLDSLDGALAIGTGRASRRGFVLDSVVDRLTEAAYAAALWVAGAPGLAGRRVRRAVLAARLPAGAGGAGRACAETGALSVWERPTRVILTGLTLGGAGVVAGLGVARRGGDGGHGRRGACSGRSPSSSWGSRCAACWPTEPAVDRGAIGPTGAGS